MKYNIAVIGGGPGGYTAAEKAAQYGYSVVLFEKEALGGTCLNRGCIPTKALLHAAELYDTMVHAAPLGVTADSITYDFSAMHTRKTEVVTTLRSGIEKMMKANKITVVAGQAQIDRPGVISCNGETYEADDIIIATGSKVAYPPIPGIHDEGVYNSRDLMEGAGKSFRSLIIIGGGVVGAECASLYMSLGCEVTILEAADHILPFMDKELAQRLTMVLKKHGVKVEAKAMVQKIEGTPGNMTVTYTDKKGGEHTVSAEGVLAAAGRSANLDGLFGPEMEPMVELFKGAVVGDADGRTALPHLYIIGDAKARNIQLAHVASAQAQNVVDVICGKAPSVDMSVVPSCVYTVPEIASVGLTEEQAKAQGIAYKTAKYLTGANGKCLIEGSDSGYVKLVVEAETGRILGSQMVCPRATDLIGELAVAVQKGLTAGELSAVIHPHPSFSEMISGAAETMRL